MSQNPAHGKIPAPNPSAPTLPDTFLYLKDVGATKWKWSKAAQKQRMGLREWGIKSLNEAADAQLREEAPEN